MFQSAEKKNHYQIISNLITLHFRYWSTFDNKINVTCSKLKCQVCANCIATRQYLLPNDLHSEITICITKGLSVNFSLSFYWCFFHNSMSFILFIFKRAILMVL